jgi:hypothetical protein
MNKRVSLWLKLVLCFSFIIISAVYFSLEARTQQTLKVRTQLRPVGWPKSDMLWFAPGIYWVDDFDGGVQSGTLDQTAILKIWNSNGKVSFGQGVIRFEQAGGVKEGTLLEDTVLCVVNTASNSKFSLTFKGKKTVEFGYDGCVMKGTLAQEATLKSSDGGSKTYPPGTLVDFNGAGLVTSAVLPPSGPTQLDGLYNGTCTIVGIGTFPFSFRASNGSFNGSQNQVLYSLQWQGNYDKAGNIQNGMMTGWVDVMEGGQKLRWTVRGPIQGTIAAAASRGTLTITTADGNRTWTGTWTAAIGPAAIQPCAHYLGPIEPLRIASAGTSQAPGTYLLVYAVVPRTPDPAQKWVWKKYGPVTLKGGKRYFVVFGRSAEVALSEESNLPPQETQVSATPDSAIIWHENDSGNGARIAYCFQPVPASGGTDKPILRMDLSPLDNLRTNQTFTLTAIAENIPSSITKLKFTWYLDLSNCVSADPPGQKVNLWYNQLITPVNGKATCSITIKAEDEPRETNFMFFVQDEPYTKAVFLSANRNYTIR